MLLKKLEYQYQYISSQKKFEQEFFFVKQNWKSVCLLCQSTSTLLKVKNFKHDREENHITFKNDFSHAS